MKIKQTFDSLNMDKWTIYYICCKYFLFHIAKNVIQVFFCSHDHIEILINSAGEQQFFRQREGQWMPTLKLLHKCETHNY